MKIRVKKKSNESPQPWRPPNSGSRGRCFRRRRRSAVAARGPLGHGRHLGPALRGPGGRVQAGPRRPCPARADAARGPLVPRLLGAQTPPGRGIPGHPQVAGTKSGQEIFRGPRRGKNSPGGASPSPPSRRATGRRPERRGGNRTPGRKMLPASENSTPAPPSAARASLADAVSRLPFPRPTRRRHLVYRPAPRRRRTSQRWTRPIAELTCAATGWSSKPLPSNPPQSPTRIGLFGSGRAPELTLDSSGST